MSSVQAPARDAGPTGRLKIFFGATPGVGKTHAMLDAARILRRDGIDVVVGAVDTRGRAELEALLDGLERLPLDRDELDLDAALRRRPAVLLLDELAHVNPAAARHRRRWQDAVDLLDAGIDVWTTLNVADLESLSDVVEPITGRRPDTVPDSLVERADEIELVDAPPEVLLARGQGRIARGDLLALRELALRQMAARVDRELQAYRRQHGMEAAPGASHRIAVCVGPGPHAARLVRAAYRLAAARQADWTAVYVETPAHAHLPQEDRDWVTQHLRLAESLGGRTVRLFGERIGSALLAWARAQDVTDILVGKPTHARWRDRLRGSLLDEIIRDSRGIEVHVSEGDATSPARRPPRTLRPGSPLASYVASVAIVLAATGVAWLMSPRFQAWDLTLVYMLATVVVATRFGRGPSVLATALSVALFDFCFLPPYFSFVVRDDPYRLTFAVMLLVGLTVSTLATRVRDQAEAARSHAQWVATLHDLSRELARARDVEEVLSVARRRLRQAADGAMAFLLPSPEGDLLARAHDGELALDDEGRAAARWVYEHGAPAGLWTDSFRDSGVLYLPLETSARIVGVLAFRPALTADGGQRSRLEALIHQVAGALERTLVSEEAKQIELRVRTEELRNALLSSVSHDLRTPLAAIIGSATTMLDAARDTLPPAQKDLVRAIHEEAERLSRLVTNLLAVTRVESKDLAVKREWVPLEEVVGAALHAIGPRLGTHEVAVQVPADLLVPIDPLLIEQLFLNLIDNAVRHTPPGTPISIAAVGDGREVQVEVADRGPGLPPGQETQIFEKFVRGTGAGAGGSGLGLAIARGVVLAHGGSIEAANAPSGGAVIRFRLPIVGTPPPVPREEETPREVRA